MMKFSLALLVSILFFTSCKKENEILSPITVNDYYPLEIGKYINYNLDSTLFVTFGTVRKVISYLAQDRVSDSITDNLGRKSFRINRYIRNDASMPWVYNTTFLATNTGGTIELVENNLRFVKLAFPLSQDFTWKGNTFINTTSLEPDIRYLDNWDYTYDSVNVPLMLNGVNIDSTLKVMERDDFTGQDPGIPGTLYAEKNYSVEKYGKGIGLIYRDFIHWVYQGKENGNGYYEGYGVTMTITGHN
ncbi:MAG: hypothetical protein ABI266_00605 [Ginsengibacter sp.]